MTDMVDRLHDDPGLQPERTVLSWTRTTVALTVASAVLLRWAAHYPALVYIVIAGMATMALWIYATQRRRYRSASLGLAGERVTPAAGSVVVLSAAMTLLGFVGLFLVATELPLSY